jgi:hypothetical protein
MNPTLCNGHEPIGVYCKTVADVSWELSGETLAAPCTLAAGGIRCLNRDNPQVGSVRTTCVLQPDGTGAGWRV